MTDEVTKIAVVRLGQEISTRVLSGRFVQNTRDRQVLGQPVAGTQHRPVEQRTRSAFVTVDERMVVSDLKMQRDGADAECHPDWCRLRTRTPSRSTQAVRRPVAAGAEPCRRYRLPGSARPHGENVRPHRVHRSHSRSTRDASRRSLLAPTPQLLHGEEVVEDHLLAAIAGLASACEHFLRNQPRCRRAFQLRGGHSFLDQRAEQIPFIVTWGVAAVETAWSQESSATRVV